MLPGALEKLALLLAFQGDPQAARRARAKAGSAGDALSRLSNAPMHLRAAEHALERCKRLNIEVLAEDQPPLSRIKGQPDAPLLLFRRGRAAPPKAKIVALVGTRDPDVYGARVAFEMARSLARAGVVVLSGGAKGIDAAAHEGALAGGGHTSAVLACGLDHPGPACNERMFDAMLAKGCDLLSEAPPSYRPSRRAFPERNRLIAAFSDAVVVVEASEQSGTMHTAARALLLRRPLFAVPGDICYSRSAGTNKLLSEGVARALCSPGELLRILEVSAADTWPAAGRRAEFLPPEWSAKPRESEDATLQSGEDEAAILEALRGKPSTPEALCEALGWPVERAAASLSLLELERRVRRFDGQRYGAA